jgi:hypothetical protein
MEYRYKIYEVCNFLERGMIVRTNCDYGNILPDNLEIYGEILYLSGKIYIGQDLYGENVESVLPADIKNARKYKYTWGVYNNNKIGYIEILNKENKSKSIRKTCGICGNEDKFIPDSTGSIMNYIKRILNKKYYCVDCFSKNVVKCCSCTGFYDKKETITGPDNNIYCRLCYSRIFIQCNGCLEWLDRHVVKQGADGGYYCPECWGLRFEKCEMCDRLRFKEQVLYSDIYEVFHCVGCQPFYKNVKAHNFIPSKWISNKSNNENDLLMGVELEVEPTVHNMPVRDYQEYAFKLKKFLEKDVMQNMFYFKRDGSVQGFEIVSHPFTLKYANKNMQWKKILEWLVKNEYTSYQNGRCGLHVHMEQKYFDKKDICKMRTFFAKGKSFIYEFSKRGGCNDNYCLYESFNKRDFLNNIIPNGRYWAFNQSTYKNTIEIRVFRGTLNYIRFISVLQFVDAVANFSKDISLVFFLNKSGKEIYEYFCEWIKNKNQYQQLSKYLENKKRGVEI